MNLNPVLLVTGADGMTGSYVESVFSGYAVVKTNIDTLDVRNFLAVRKAITKNRPDIVLHLAAETDLDSCERDPRHAYETNYCGTLNVAAACRETQTFLVSFSSTTVYAGGDGAVFDERDRPHPIQVYGKTKLKGEDYIRANLPNYLIIRPGWVFGGFDRDKKFVGVLRQQIIYGGERIVKGVRDVRGNPVYAKDCLTIVRRLLSMRAIGTFNVVNAGVCSRFEMARLIATHYGVEARAVELEEFGLTARRPISQVVKPVKLRNLGLTPDIQSWQAALKAYLTEWDTRDDG